MIEEIKERLGESEGKWVVKIKTKYGPLKIEEIVKNVFKNFKCINNYWSPYLNYGLLEICFDKKTIYIIWNIGDEEILEIIENENFDMNPIIDEISSANIENSVLRLMRGQF